MQQEIIVFNGNAVLFASEVLCRCGFRCLKMSMEEEVEYNQQIIALDAKLNRCG